MLRSPHSCVEVQFSVLRQLQHQSGLQQLYAWRLTMYTASVRLTAAVRLTSHDVHSIGQAYSSCTPDISRCTQHRSGLQQLYAWRLTMYTASVRLTAAVRLTSHNVRSISTTWPRTSVSVLARLLLLNSQTKCLPGGLCIQGPQPLNAVFDLTDPVLWI